MTIVPRHTHRSAAIFAACAGVLACSALCGLARGSEPSTTPPRGKPVGRLVGTVDKPAAVKALFAYDRSVISVKAADTNTEDPGKQYPGSVDPATGAFVVEKLPLDASYDLVVDLASGARLEGVSLKVPRSDYEEEQPLPPEDIPVIKKTALNLNKFEDTIEFLGLDGNIQHAAVLVTKLKHHPFYGSKPGEVIWRLELWHFEKPEETWIKTQDELFIVFYRKRMPKAEFLKRSLTLDAKLGGHVPTAKAVTVDLGPVELPAAEPGVRLRNAKGAADPAKKSEPSKPDPAP